MTIDFLLSANSHREPERFLQRRIRENATHFRIGNKSKESNVRSYLCIFSSPILMTHTPIEPTDRALSIDAQLQNDNDTKTDFCVLVTKPPACR